MTTTRSETGRRGGGSPLSESIPSVFLVCPVHGLTEHRAHKVGFDKQGNQRYRTRCRECHRDKRRAALAEHRL